MLQLVDLQTKNTVLRTSFPVWALIHSWILSFSDLFQMQLNHCWFFGLSLIHCRIFYYTYNSWQLQLHCPIFVLFMSCHVTYWHAVKRVPVRNNVVLANVGARWRRMVKFTSRPLCPLNRKLGRPQSRAVRFREGKICCSWRIRTPDPPTRSLYFALPTAHRVKVWLKQHCIL